MHAARQQLSMLPSVPANTAQDTERNLLCSGKEGAAVLPSEAISGQGEMDTPLPLTQHG